MTRSFASVDHDACGVGFVAQLGSPGSREVVERALEALRRLGHRGGLDADGRSGDGAGLLTPIPDKFVRSCAREAGIELPSVLCAGDGFLASRARRRRARLDRDSLHESHGLRLLGWRAVPTDPSIVGPRALETLPVIQQCFFAPVDEAADLESDLFGLRKEVESAAPKRNLFLLSLFANRRLQRIIDAGAIASVLFRSGGSGFCQSFRDLSSALLD